MLSVKLLTDEEFDSLPYPEARMSLGVADTKSGQAFVRYTHSNELNQYLINHELEHLLGEDRDEIHHGGDGVYYKGFGNLFSGLGQMFQGAGQSVMGAGRSIGQAAKGAGQSIMGMFGGGKAQKPLEVGMKGASGNAGRMGPQFSGQINVPMLPSAGMAPRMNPQVAPIRQASSAFNAFSQFKPQTPKPQAGASPSVSMPKPQAQAPQNPMANFQLPMPSNAPIGSQTIRSASGAPMSSVAPSRMAGFQPPPMFTTGGGAPNVLPQTRPGTPTPPVSTPNTGAGKSPMGMFGKNPQQTLLGAGLEGIGQFGIQTPNMPDISELPSVQQLRSFNFNSASELDPALEQAINNDFQRIEERETQAFIARYKSLRPGADIESDSNFKRDLFELQRMQGQRRADALAKYRFEMMQQNLAFSQAELAQLQEMAQMDIDMIMGQMGLDYADAQKFKDTFSRLGDTMISQGLGIGQGQEEEVAS